MAIRRGGRGSGRFAAIDFGATSGRVILGTVSANRIVTAEMSRFANRPVRMPVPADRPSGQTATRLHWDAPALWQGALDGLARAVREAPDLISVATDTWGVDYGLLRGGRLLGNPIHYRDERTAEAFDRVHEAIPPAELYARTGIEPLAINTVYQLAAEGRDGLLDIADTALLTPDLFSFWLSGRRVAERTIASTTALLSAVTGEWDREILRTLRLPADILAPLVSPGDRIGALLPSVADAIGASGSIDVVAVGAHDTASAVLATPLPERGGAFVSCGTWGLAGMERASPVLDDAARVAAFTNERGVDDRFLFMRNGMGLWILNETIRGWERDGDRIEIAALVDEASRVTPDAAAVFDVEDARFQSPGDMPARIAAWCAEHDVPAPTGRAELVRSIVESLAQAFAGHVAEAARLAGERVTQINIVGGGSRNALLCQRLADRAGVPVLAGPVEATALGSILVQARTAGVLDGTIDDLRAVITRTFSPRRFEPSARAAHIPPGGA